MTRRRPLITLALAGTATIVSASLATVTGASAAATVNNSSKTTSPIKHVVVLFQENVSFDHYFGTYPNATNADGQPFTAKRGTPTVNGLTPELLTANPNGVNPQRLGAANILTCDQDHNYTPEQQALDGGLMDKFPAFTEVESCSPPDTAPPGLVMDYYDGNTVTALWNYAQRFAMSDNDFDTTFGPSTPGVLNLVSGQTHGTTPAVLAGVTDNGTDYGDADPTFDECSAGSTIAMSGTNIGNELNARKVTWGWFQGGFAPTGQVNGTVVCGSSHTNVGGATVADYSAHHEPFQYYASTANPAHLPPVSEAEVGHNGQANHQYDLSYFYQSLSDGNLPAVSFVKAAKYQDGHAGYSDPTDEQTFLVNTINAIEQSRFWKSTAIVITYDDSDGWYDQVMPPIVNPSTSAEDALTGTGQCGNGTPAGGFEDRCGYSQRLPLLVISPYARENSVDNALTDTTSILRFIEDNWSLPRIGGGSFDAHAGTIDGMFDFTHRIPRPLILNPATGEPAA
jgi:phospholipase C